MDRLTRALKVIDTISEWTGKLFSFLVLIMVFLEVRGDSEVRFWCSDYLELGANHTALRSAFHNGRGMGASN